MKKALLLLLIVLSITPLLMARDSAKTQVPIVQGPDTAFYLGTAVDSFPPTVQSSLEIIPGEAQEVCAFYSDPTDVIQGFQLAIEYSCDLHIVNNSFSIEGTIAEAVGAEFVTSQIDNDPTDGDGCELVAGILLDVLPPFEGQTVPQSSNPLKIACFDVTVGSGPFCSDESYNIEFKNGVNGLGLVPIDNSAIINYQSEKNITFTDATVDIIGEGNGSGDANGDGRLDIADPVYILNYLFASGPSPIPLGASDVNNDQITDSADVAYLLSYLFQGGEAPSDSCPL